MRGLMVEGVESHEMAADVRVLARPLHCIYCWLVPISRFFMTFSSAGRRQKREQHLSFALTPSFRRYICRSRSTCTEGRSTWPNYR